MVTISSGGKPRKPRADRLMSPRPDKKARTGSPGSQGTPGGDKGDVNIFEPVVMSGKRSRKKVDLFATEEEEEAYHLAQLAKLGSSGGKGSPGFKSPKSLNTSGKSGKLSPKTEPKKHYVGGVEVILDEKSRVAIWHTESRRKLIGTSAPSIKQLRQYLTAGWELYHGQDGGAWPPPPSPKSLKTVDKASPKRKREPEVAAEVVELPPVIEEPREPRAYTAEFNGRWLGSWDTPEPAVAAFAKAFASYGDSGSPLNGGASKLSPSKLRGSPRFTREGDILRNAPLEVTGETVVHDGDVGKLGAKVSRVRDWLPKGWSYHINSPEAKVESVEISYSHPMVHQHFFAREEVEEFMDSGCSYLPRTEPISPPEDSEDDSPREEVPEEKPWVPKPDPFAEIQSQSGISLSRGFKTYRRIAAVRPLMHPDPNDLLEAYYFHAPHLFRHTCPSGIAPRDDRSDPDYPEGATNLPPPYELQLIADSGGEAAWQRCQYANAEWRRTAKLRADMREKRDNERREAYQPHGLSADSWDR